MIEWLLSETVTPMWAWLILTGLLAFGLGLATHFLGQSMDRFEQAQAYYFAARLHTALHSSSPSSPTDSENTK